MKLRHVRQPEDSFQCAQCSVAMVTEKTLEEVIEIGYAGHTGATSVTQILAAVIRLGMDYRDYTKHDNRRKLVLPQERGVICVYNKKTRWGHLIAFDEDGYIYDPEGEVYESFAAFKKGYESDGKWLVDFYMTVKAAESCEE